MLLDDLVEKFKATADVTDLRSAITKAHADMARRAKGHKDAIRDESVEWLARYLETSSPFQITDQGAFDEWHTTTCNAYCERMNTFIRENGFSFAITYGRAQKVLNMTFKYLYCTGSYRAPVESIAPYLHMTLDGYTLKWYKQVVLPAINVRRTPGTPKLKGTDVPEWSKMDEPGKHPYSDIQKRIREYLPTAAEYRYSIQTGVIDEEIEENTQRAPQNRTLDVSVPFDSTRNSPFYAEFIVWAGETVRAKMTNLLKGLNGMYQNWTDDRWAINNALTAELKNKIAILLRSI